ncbi:MAG: hypothetical protein M9921_02135 [Fimbriimonadaceae bacterium]|nr:hypothetical protein [Chthonomonadaceae bacterium]MCO5295636.1 hypothetical protein [Fimbriimonadaceae bacterium]
MLPILPALLLLLVNTPSKLDRVDCVRAWGALETLQRQLEAGSAGPDGDREQTQRALASLLALRIPPAEFGRALATLLHFDAVEPAAAGGEAPETAATGGPVEAPPPLARLRSGSLECRRSRDGPWIR